MQLKFKHISVIIFISITFIYETYAQERFALVIGNSKYENQKPLANPTNDAKDLASALKNVGFDVHIKLNADHESMEKSIRDFGGKLKKNSVGLFYFSGHGVQYEGKNYLIPTKISNIIKYFDLRYKSVDTSFILESMKQNNNKLNIIILDACRNNPFKGFSKNLDKGLSKLSGVEGTIIAYATSPGEIALDGDGRNSPYAKYLVKLIEQPNLDVEILLRELNKRVKKETRGVQIPWYEASIDEAFYFNPGERVIANIQKKLQNSIKSVGRLDKELMPRSSGIINEIVYGSGEFDEKIRELDESIRHIDAYVQYATDYIGMSTEIFSYYNSFVDSIMDFESRCQVTMERYEMNKETMVFDFYKRQIDECEAKLLEFKKSAMSFADEVDGISKYSRLLRDAIQNMLKLKSSLETSREYEKLNKND